MMPACVKSLCLSSLTGTSHRVQPPPHRRSPPRRSSLRLPIALNVNMFFASTSGFARLLCRRCSGVARTDDSLTLGAAAAEDGDLHALLQILPHDVRDNLLYESNLHQLLEVSTEELEYESWEETIELELWALCIGYLQSGIRMGIIGLTCRVGRPHRENLDMVRDLLEYGKSILFLGRSLLIQAMKLEVMGTFHTQQLGERGDTEPFMQHKVMIEAVENHMPEVIIVDEIGTAAEVNACRTIAQRGVMLIGSAHGKWLEDIIKKPTLSDLIGGLETVILSDQEARSRNCKKSILERRAAPTFPFLIEMRERHYWVAHQVRRRDKQFKVVIERWKIDE